MAKRKQTEYINGTAQHWQHERCGADHLAGLSSLTVGTTYGEPSVQQASGRKFQPMQLDFSRARAIVKVANTIVNLIQKAD